MGGFFWWRIEAVLQHKKGDLLLLRPWKGSCEEVLRDVPALLQLKPGHRLLIFILGSQAEVDAFTGAFGPLENLLIYQVAQEEIERWPFLPNAIPTLLEVVEARKVQLIATGYNEASLVSALSERPK
jgi:hypothetical protein